MRNRVFRPIAAIPCILLMAAVSAQASPVQLNDVVNVVSGSSRYGWQNASTELRLVPQEGKAATTSTATPQETVAGADGSAAGGIQVQTEEITEVTAEECACEDIPVVGGFPKWPFLALIPAVCLTGICTPDNECPATSPRCRTTPTPTPSIPMESVPEPATLLLFGTGLAALGAGARRRYSRTKAAKQVATN